MATTLPTGLVPEQVARALDALARGKPSPFIIVDVLFPPFKTTIVDPAYPEHKTVVGHVSDPRVTAQVGAWTRAALGHAELQTLRLARFGDNLPAVLWTELDGLRARLGS